MKSYAADCGWRLGTTASSQVATGLCLSKYCATWIGESSRNGIPNMNFKHGECAVGKGQRHVIFFQLFGCTQLISTAQAPSFGCRAEVALCCPQVGFFSQFLSYVLLWILFWMMVIRVKLVILSAPNKSQQMSTSCFPALQDAPQHAGWPCAYRVAPDKKFSTMFLMRVAT